MTTPSRKPRCRLTDRLGNRCPNEALTDLACLKHTRQIAEEWQQLVANAVEQYPRLGDLLNDDPA